jgi:hypothetical protein
LRHQNCFKLGGISGIRETMKMQAQTSGSNAREPSWALPAWAVAPAFVGFLAVAAVYVFCLIFSQFRFYDDEGFLMICVKGYLEGNPLYDSVGTCYGPVYFFYEWLVHGVVSIPLTHDATGLLCAFHWLLAATILSVAGWRLTRSLPVAVFVFAQSVVHLETMAGEPGHPQEIIVVLLASAVLIAQWRTACRWTLPLLGAIGACLYFTKINVGVFFLLALLLSLACYSPFFKNHRKLFWVLVLLTLCLPLVLMRRHLAEAWGRHFCWQTCAGMVAASAVACAYSRGKQIRLREWMGTGIALAGLSGLFLEILLLTGSSWSAILFSTVQSPANLAGVFCVPLRVEHYSWSAAGALGLAIMAVALRDRVQRWRLPLAAAKGVYGAAGGLLLVQDPFGQLGCLLPWAWLLLVPSDEDAAAEDADQYPRALLCLAAVWQGVQAYPVGCTQAAVGTFLAVLVYSLCAYDAVRALAPVVLARLKVPSYQSRRVALTCCLGFFTVLFALFVFKWTTPLEHWRYYVAAPPLDLRGAHLIRANPADASTYRMLTKYIQTECDTFVALPGLNSLYFWSGKRPPTYLNICGEGIMPSDYAQGRIVAALRMAKRPLIVQRETKWAPGIRAGDMTKGELPSFIRDECREVTSLGKFHILALRNVTRSGAPGHIAAASEAGRGGM